MANVKFKKTLTKAQYDALQPSEKEADMLYFLGGNANNPDTKDVRLVLNGKDYSGIKKIETGSINGSIKVDGVDVVVKNAATSSDITTVVRYETQALTESQKTVIKNNILSKEYDVTDFSGLGKRFLPRNIQRIDGVYKNILPTTTVGGNLFIGDNKGNTIYTIDSDYDLNGQTVHIPAGCTLDFDGGSISNGLLVLNDTYIKGIIPKILCNTSGNIKNDTINVSWFGCDSTGTTDNSSIIRRLFEVYSDKVLYFPTGQYLIAESIDMPRNCNISGDGENSIIISSVNEWLFNFRHDENISNDMLRIDIRNINFRGPYVYPTLSTDPDNNTDSGMLKTYEYTYIYKCVFDNVTISNFKNCVDIEKAYWTRFNKTYFYYYKNALTLSAANSSSVAFCMFRAGYVGLTLKRSVSAENAGTGLTIIGNDFSENRVCGLHITSMLSGSSITGNYFECQPGRQFIIGTENDNAINAVAGLSGSTVTGNNGLYLSNVTGIDIYGAYVNNFSDATGLNFKTDSTGSGNRGVADTPESINKFTEVWHNYQSVKYRKGIKESLEDKSVNLKYEGIVVPAGATIRIDTIIYKNFKLLHYFCSNFNVKLIINDDDDSNLYLVGRKENSVEIGIDPGEDTRTFWGSAFDTYTTGNALIRLKNTGSSSAIVDVNIKYFVSIYDNN